MVVDNLGVYKYYYMEQNFKKLKKESRNWRQRFSNCIRRRWKRKENQHLLHRIRSGLRCKEESERVKKISCCTIFTRWKVRAGGLLFYYVRRRRPWMTTPFLC